MGSSTGAAVKCEHVNGNRGVGRRGVVVAGHAVILSSSYGKAEVKGIMRMGALVSVKRIAEVAPKCL